MMADDPVPPEDRPNAAPAAPNANADADATLQEEEHAAPAEPNADADADSREGLDDAAATESDTDSDGDEAPWAATDGLEGAHRALRVQGLAWEGVPRARRRRVWLELSGARRRAGGDAAVPPSELRHTTEELEQTVGARFAADVKLDCGRGGGHTTSKERLVLRRVLLAVAARFPETGYAQGLNVVAATLLEAVGSDENVLFWLLAELVDGRLKGWWAGDFSVSLGAIASALGKWSALHGEDECLPCFATTWALSLFGQHAGRPTPKPFRIACLDAILCAREGGVAAVLGLVLAAADVVARCPADDMVEKGLAVARAFASDRRAVLLAAQRLARTALVEVAPGQLLFDAPSEFFWLATARRVAEARLGPVEAAIEQVAPSLYATTAETRRAADRSLAHDEKPLLLILGDPSASDACSYVAAELLGVDQAPRSPPDDQDTSIEPSCRPEAAPGNVRYRWGDAATDVSSFGVPVRSRPTPPLRRVDAAVVVDAEVAQRMLAEADGVILVLDASAPLSTPWSRHSAPVEAAAFASMDAGGPLVHLVFVATDGGDGGDDCDASAVASHWNARGTQTAFRRAGIALAAAGARLKRPIPNFGVLGTKTTRTELRALSKLVDSLPAASAEKAVAALLARCDAVRAIATTLDALAATPPSRLYRWSNALVGLVTPETVQPVVDDWSAYRALPDDARPTLAASAAAWEGLDSRRLATWASTAPARKRLDRALDVEAPAMLQAAQRR